MNSEEVKDILQLCRPGHAEDINDPLITEAFEKLDQDSELCVWFEEQQIMDAMVCEELERIVPPQNLKTLILDGMRQRSKQTEADQQDASSETSRPKKVIAPDSSSASSSTKIVWFRPFIGIAAVFMFASMLLFFSRQASTPQTAEENLADNEMKAEQSAEIVAGIPDIIQFLSQQIAGFDSSEFNKRSENINELQSYLALYGMPRPSEIPRLLENTPTIGCVTFDYGGTRMSMICFKNGQVYHLVTVNKADLHESKMLDLSHSKAKVYEHQKQAFKVWSNNDQVYILCVDGTVKDLPEFI